MKPRKLLIAMTIGVMTAVPAFAQDATTTSTTTTTPPASEQPAVTKTSKQAAKEEVRSLLRQRDKLVSRLNALDLKAADAMKNGEQPLGVWAEQTSLQDQVDLLNFRLDVLATRHGIELPSPKTEAAKQDDANKARKQAMRNFERGRIRGIKVLRSQTKEFLASIEFGSFLENIAADPVVSQPSE